MRLNLSLKDGDYVVAAFPFHEKVYVITRFGAVFDLQIDYRDGKPVIRVLDPS